MKSEHTSHRISGTRLRVAVPAVLLLTLGACDKDSVTAPSDEADPGFGPSPYVNCMDDSGIRICIGKAEYAPVELVPFTVANSLDRAVFVDGCSGGVEGLQPSGDWGGNYGVARLCANFVTSEDIVANMRRLPQRSVVHDTLHVNHLAFAGEWRIWIRILDENAEPLRDEPFTSPVFRVRR